MKLIVNADDYGFSSGINTGIIKSYRNGITTSTSVVCNTKCFDKEINELRKVKGIGKGVHLNLTLGKSVTGLSSLTNKKGFFEGAYRLIVRISTNRIEKEDVKEELEAQICNVMNGLDKVDHIDSHQHIHILPQIYPIVLNLARKYKIRFIRIPRQNFWIYPTNRIIEKILLIGLSSVNAHSSNEYKKINNFFGVFKGGLSASRFREIVNKFRPGAGELVCHPAYPDYFIEQNWRNLKKDRLIDLNTLISPAVRRIVKEKNISLVKFSDL